VRKDQPNVECRDAAVADSQFLVSSLIGEAATADFLGLNA
jgi:hypothetical protein